MTLITYPGLYLQWPFRQFILSLKVKLHSVQKHWTPSVLKGRHHDTSSRLPLFSTEASISMNKFTSLLPPLKSSWDCIDSHLIRSSMTGRDQSYIILYRNATPSQSMGAIRKVNQQIMEVVIWNAIDSHLLNLLRLVLPLAAFPQCLFDLFLPLSFLPAYPLKLTFTPT